MTDLGLVFFAIWIVGRLQMKLKQKIRICCLLSLGTLYVGLRTPRSAIHGLIDSFTVPQVARSQKPITSRITIIQLSMILPVRNMCPVCFTRWEYPLADIGSRQ